jgi:DNA (cytosine-5)-methyltransferase 1
VILRDELVVDNFAGGGGASYGIEQAIERAIDYAINHDAEAIAVHRANHPLTKHLIEDVWAVDPAKLCAGRPVGLAWFSPDCKHFSKAKGGKPVEKKIRGLAWVVIRWARAVRPRVIMLENVEEFQTWGPLTADGMPDPSRKGRTFRSWRRALERLGYEVELRELRASHYGAPTIRKRLFIIARCDGQPIVWPNPTHGPGLLPYRTAGDCIDWSLPCPSIFERKRPLADATLSRIARGLKRFVFDAAEPFIVTCNHEGGGFRGQGLKEPLRTVCRSRDAHGLVMPFVEQANTGAPAHGIAEPLSTIMGKGANQRLVVPMALRIDHRGAGSRGASDVRDPLATTTTENPHALVTSHLLKLYGSCPDGQQMTLPFPTIRAGGTHLAEVRAFLIKYYGVGTGQTLFDPMHSITTKDRLGLVLVRGVEYQIVDVGLRMLQPRELYRAQGFPDHYIIEPEVDGRKLSKTAQVRMCGNSVCPPMARALVEANLCQQPARVAVKGA